MNRPLALRLHDGRPEALLAWEGGSPFFAVLDSGAPLTLLAAAGGEGASASGEVRLRDAARANVTRFIFHNAEVRGLGAAGGVSGILGADILGRFSVGLRLGAATPTLTLRDEIPDRSEDIARDCDVERIDGASPQRCTAVFATPRRGGGLARIGDEDVAVAASRLVVTVCLAPPAPAAACAAQRVRGGVPMVAVVATGLATSMISRAAAARLAGEDPALVPVAGKARRSAPYGAGVVPGLTVGRLAVVGNRTADLGPCRELAWRRKIHACRRTLPQEELRYAGAAVAEIARPVTLAVVGDETPAFVGLRQELSPGVAEVDLVLGADILRSFEADLDYPNDRTLLRCAAGTTPATCRVLPACETSDAPACLAGR